MREAQAALIASPFSTFASDRAEHFTTRANWLRLQPKFSRSRDKFSPLIFFGVAGARRFLAAALINLILQNGGGNASNFFSKIFVGRGAMSRNEPHWGAVKLKTNTCARRRFQKLRAK